MQKIRFHSDHHRALRARRDDGSYIVFSDGRADVHGDDVELLRAYAKVIAGVREHGPVDDVSPASSDPAPPAAAPVDFDFFKYQKHVRRPTEPFVFLHRSPNMHDQRFGAGAALQAFREAFPDAENVKLVLRADVGSIPTQGDARIEIRLGKTDAETLRFELYEANAFIDTPADVAPHGAVEAVACGCPLLTARGGEGSENLAKIDNDGLVPLMRALLERYPRYVSQAALASKDAQRRAAG